MAKRSCCNLSGFQPEAILPPTGHLAMSGAIIITTGGWGVCYWCLLGRDQRCSRSNKPLGLVFKEKRYFPFSEDKDIEKCLCIFLTQWLLWTFSKISLPGQISKDCAI